MLVQKHREYYKPESEGCFAVGKSLKEIMNDLKEYMDKHKDLTVYYFVHPVRPNKENLRPEYMMEIDICENEYHPLMVWNNAARTITLENAFINLDLINKWLKEGSKCQKN